MYGDHRVPERSRSERHTNAWLCGVVALLCAYGGEAYSQDVSLEARLASMPKHVAEDLRKNVRQPAGQPVGDGRAIAQALRSQDEKNSVTVRFVRGSVAATARCTEGYVEQRVQRASARDVVIESEEMLDCEVEGCRAFRVIARRDLNIPFDLHVSVTCSA